VFALKDKGNPVYRLQHPKGRIAPEDLMRSPSSSFSPNRQAQQLIDVFDREIDVEYRGERYRVRDNGCAHRMPQKRQKSRPLDEQWTFGRQGLSTGYMYLSGVPVHRIVCVAFNGEPPTDRHVVDHIDTNRANNRPENLRWVTRLENVLLNEISARRIELVYGSIEAFFADPSRIQNEKVFPDISWMRTLSKDEAAAAKVRLKAWATSESVPSGGALGEWLYGTKERARDEPPHEEFESLTPSVVQVKWRVPTEFPQCPETMTDDALDRYAENLKFGCVFARNHIYQSLVVHSALGEDGLVVLTRNPSDDAIKDWAVAHIGVRGEFFYHRSENQYFSLQGALKTFCELVGESDDDCVDDYC
jgi:hypothetical protein